MPEQRIIQTRGADAREELERELRCRIFSNNPDCATPLPTELELARQYGIGRSTVRKVLQILIDEGVLIRKHGIGSFIRPPAERNPDQLKKGRLLVMLPGYPGDLQRLNRYDRRLLAGVADYSLIHQWDVELREIGDEAETLLAQFRALRFDGIIWERPDYKSFQEIARLRDAGVPQVTISRRVEGVPSIFFDYRSGIQDAMRFLHGIGHREIVFLDLDIQHDLFANRAEIFMQALAGYGATAPERNIYRSNSEAFTSADLDRILAEHPTLTAIFFAVPLAPRLLDMLALRKIGIPDRLSLLSFGDSDYLGTESSISHLSEPRESIGLRACALIALQRIGKAAPQEPEYCKGQLLIRRSCQSPPP